MCQTIFILYLYLRLHRLRLYTYIAFCWFNCSSYTFITNTNIYNNKMLINKKLYVLHQYIFSFEKNALSIYM